MTCSIKNLAETILGMVMLFVSIAAAIGAPDCATYYVDSVGGNDNNNGASPGSAWQSLDKVNSMVFKPGDSILFKANCSWTGKLKPKGSGDSSKQITIGMYGYESTPRNSRNKPHIEGGGIYATVLLKDVEYWTISNLDVSNKSNSTEIQLRNGILVLAKPTGITHRMIIQDCEVHNVDGDCRRKIGMYEKLGDQGLVSGEIFRRKPVRRGSYSTKLRAQRKNKRNLRCFRSQRAPLKSTTPT